MLLGTSHKGNSGLGLGAGRELPGALNNSKHLFALRLFKPRTTQRPPCLTLIQAPPSIPAGFLLGSIPWVYLLSSLRKQERICERNREKSANWVVTKHSVKLHPMRDLKNDIHRQQHGPHQRSSLQQVGPEVRLPTFWGWGLLGWQQGEKKSCCVS